MIRVFCAILSLAIAPSALLADVIPTPTEGEESQPLTLLEVGLKHIQAGNLDQAESALRSYLRSEPQSTETMMWLAEVLFQKNDIEGAANQVRRVIQLEPNHAAAHHSLARYHFLHQDFDESLALLKRAIALDPSLFAAHIDLADYYVMIDNDLPMAIATYEDAISIRPEHAGARYGLGIALSRAGDFDAAEKSWRSASRLEPANPLPMYALGNSLMTQGKPEAAVLAYTRALEAEPSHVDSILALGRIYASRGDSRLAKREFNRALAIIPNNALAHLNIALIEQQNGQKAAAINSYRLSLGANEAQPLAHNNLAWLLAEDANSRKEALRHARRATDLQPRVGPYWDTLGWIQHLIGENKAALSSLENAISLEPQAGVYEHLAEVHTALGNASAANEARRMANSLRDE